MVDDDDYDGGGSDEGAAVGWGVMMNRVIPNSDYEASIVSDTEKTSAQFLQIYT